MSIRRYLPSARFTLIVGALAAGVGLIGTSLWAVSPHQNAAWLQNAGATGAVAGLSDSNWQEAFASSTAFQAAADIQSKAERLVQSSQTKNLTENIGRSLLINSAAAQGQGIGGVQTTQDQIVAGTLAQIQKASQAEPDAYSIADITTVPDSSTVLHEYGNALASILAVNSRANYSNVMLPVSLAIDNNEPAQLSGLSSMATAYRKLAKDIAGMTVPQSLRDTQLQIANNYARMGTACTGMQVVLSDPARGLVALQNYSGLFNKNEALFIELAGKFKNSRILFENSEPGHVWDFMLVAPQQ